MIGIIGAMAEEVASLKAKIAGLTETERFGFKFYQGTMAEKDVVLMQSGIGKVNAAVGTTILLEAFPVKYVINIGTAGGLLPSARVLDIVLSEKVGYHDVDVTGFNYPYGQIPGFPLYFISDNALLTAAQTILKEENLPYHQGLIVSGDTFVYQESQAEKVRRSFPEAIALEMEAAAISQVCHIYNKPFIVIRSLSDIAGKKSHISFDAYLTESAKRASVLVEKLLQKSPY